MKLFSHILVKYVLATKNDRPMKALELRAHTHKHSHTRPWTQSLIRTLRTLTWLKSLIKYTRIHILGYISNSRNSQTLKLDICSYTELINRAPLLLLWLVSVQPHIAPVSPVSGSAEVRGRRSEEQEQEAAEEWQSKGGV